MDELGRVLAYARPAPRAELNEAIVATTTREQHCRSRCPMKLHERIWQFSLWDALVMVTPLAPHLVTTRVQHQPTVPQRASVRNGFEAGALRLRIASANASPG